MFVKLAVFACLVAATVAVYNGPLAGGLPASLYPAGVSPQACPNFPHCTNPAVAANPNAAAPVAAYNAPVNYGQYNGGYNNGGYNNGGYNNALDNGAYTGDGDYHGEGLAESGAYGDVSHGYNSGAAYNPQAGAYNAAAYGNAGVVPAGVDPHSCPNYPFCH